MADLNISKIVKSHKRLSILRGLFATTACLVVFVTTYMLILPALTLEGALICGKTEHEHTESCYSSSIALTCTEEEYEGHTHTDACYATSESLTCGREESSGHSHVASEFDEEGNVICQGCYDVDGNVVCGQEESAGHTHDSSCYTTDTYLVCELAESEGHTHGDACYTTTEELTCTQEEHMHVTSCFESKKIGDPNADVETQAMWEKTMSKVTLTGEWSVDILEIAKSQLGYTESTRNYVYDDNNNKKGYTRYGAWYGYAYGDWCAMFVSFCVHYTGIGRSYMPIASNCQNWIGQLKEKGMYASAKNYTPKPGDLIYFDWDNDGISDHIGIVESVDSKKVYTIEGNSSNRVQRKTYNLNNNDIMGYGKMPENPVFLAEKEAELAAELEAEREAEEELESSDEAEIAVLSLEDEDGDDSGMEEGIALLSDGDSNGAAHDFTNDINDIYVSVNGTYITPTDGAYQISQNDTVKFELEYTLPGHTLDNTNTITYHVPTNGLQAQSGNVMGTVNGVAKTAGTYTVTSDGTVTIVFNDEFVTQNQAGNRIDGTIALYESASSIVGNDSDQGNIKFRDDKDYTFRITDRVVTNYDLSLTKTQSNVQDGKVTYTIEVSSSKGTDGQQVSLTDTLDKMQINGNVTIQDKNGNTITTLTDKNGQSSFNYNLPAMNAGDKYTITYQAEAAASETGDMVYGSNTAKAEFTDHEGNKYEPSQTINTTFDRSVISKNGSQNGNEIVWTITVNDSHQNIAGWELTDEMMKGMDITVNGGSSSDYTYDKTNGKLTFHDNGTNTNTYTITFSTPVTEGQYGTGVTNTATLKDKNQNPHTADKQVWVNRPAEVQPVYKSGTKQSDGSILWTITVVGAADVDLANKVLTDDAFKDPTFQLVSVTRNYWNGEYDVTQDYVLDTSAGTLTFNPINGGANTNRYEIKYTVMPTYQFGQNTFTNVGQLSGYSPVTSTVDGGNIQPGSKTGNGTTVENDTVIANWHATVGGDFEIQGPWTFQDWLDEDSGYYTMEQLKEIEASIRNMGITNFTMTAFTSSTQYNPADGVTVNSSASGDGQYKKYVISFQDTLAKGTVLSWDYHSTGAGKGQTKTYYNHATINNNYQYDASVSYESIPLLKKINLYGDTLTFTENNPNMNYVNWLLEINIPAGTTDTEWTITEHVPEGLNPVYIDAVLNQNGYPNDENFSITYSKDGSGDYMIKFNPSLYAGQTKYIKVAGLVRESEIPMNSDKTTATKVYGNSATITYTDGKTYEVGPVNKTVERKYEDNTLAKGAEYDQETGIITYHIDIDPSKVVDEDDKSYSVVDEITYLNFNGKLEIIPGSIIVTETLTGRTLGSAECLIIEGERVESYGSYTQKIYFTIVSDQPLCIEYKYRFTDTAEANIGITNHVTLENSRGWKSETQNQTNTYYKESDATAVVNSYPVYKVDAADHTTFLPGATFTIYKWDNSSQSYVQDATAVTEADGSLRNPNGFTRNVAYKIVETAAPTGYQVNTTPIEFYTKDKNTVKYPMSVPDDFAGTAMAAGGVIYFEDTRVEGDRDTQISVKKLWVDYLGNDISNNVNTDIQFVLKRIEKKYSAGSSGASGSDALPGVVVKFRYSDGYFITRYLENASIGDSITAKLKSSWAIYDESGNLNESYIPPTVNGVQIASSAGFNSSDRYSFYTPITVNARVITIDIPYDRNNGNNALTNDLDCYVTSSGGSTGGTSGGDSSSLLDTIVTTVGTYTVTKSGNYEWNSQDLPAYRVNSDGTISTYTYYIEEIGVQGYLTSYSRNDSTNGVSAGTITITNTQPNENEDTQIEVQKVWRYSDNTLMIDEDKPADAVIEVWQVANGDKANAVQLTDKTVTLNASNSWKATVSDLPKVRKSGNDVTSYTYYFVEQTQAGYEVTYSNGDIALSQGTVIITNKQTDNPEDTDTSVTASKVWKDSNENTIDAPTDQQIILDLYQIIDDGEPILLEDQSITLPDNRSWSKTVENLPLTRIDEENSAVEHQYKYYFVEREVPTGYEVSYTNTAARPMTGGTETITNTKTTGITVNKKWLDANGNDITGSMGDTSVQIQLIQVEGGSNAGRAAVRARTAARSGGGYTVNYGFGHYGASGLVSGTETCDSGTVMTITIKSANTPTVRTWPDGYNYDWNSTTISPTGDPVDAGNGFQTYTYQITITDNLNIGGITADNDGTVTVSFSGGSSGGESGGGESGGGESGGGESGGGESGGGESGGGEIQPTESVYATTTLSAANSWTASFANLPVTGTNASGQTVSYTYYVKEISVPNYTTTYTNNSGITDGIITVINTGTRTPEYTEVTIEKEWKGSDGQPLSTETLAGLSARFKLMTYSGSNKDEATQYGETFTLPDENGNWTRTFTGLPKTTYDASGNAVHWKYYFVEVEPDETTEVNYQKESVFSFLPWVNGSEEASEEAISGGKVTVTNTIKPETTTISVQKIWWDDQGNEMDPSQIPAGTTIKVDLYRITDNQGDPEKVNEDPIELSADSESPWRYENTELVKKEYVDGVVHTYTYYFVETSNIGGYTTTYQSGTSEAVETASTIPISEDTFRIINRKELTTSVTVSKAWFKDTNGSVTNITSAKSGYIEFYLYRVATYTGSTEPDTPTHEHTWGEGVVTTEPGEYTEGVRTYTCTGCGETRTEPIGALGHTHNWTSSVTTAATCSSTGVRTYTCSRCGNSYTETIPVDSGNHTGETYIDGAYEATATTEGYTGNTKCSGCGATLKTGTTIPATGGGEVDPPSGGSYTVTILGQQWNGTVTRDTVSVPAGQSLIVTFETTGQVNQMNCGWYKAGDYAYNGTKLTCELLSTRTDEIETWKIWNMMQVVYTPTQDSNLYLNSDSDINVNWSLSGASVQSASARSAAPRLMSAPARSASSQTPSIPSNAELLGTYRVYSDKWTDTWTFPAEKDYTYTYYVVEIGNDNYTTTYSGQGSGNITISNTITERTYSLPHTGGIGTTKITLLALIMMIMSALGFMVKINTERRKTGKKTP